MGWRPNTIHRHVRAFVDRARIDCEHLFEFQCPRYWAQLDDTGDPARRFCQACRQPVHLVTDEAELRERAARRECVAVILPGEVPERPHGLDEEDGGRPEMITMGMVARPDDWD